LSKKKEGKVKGEKVRKEISTTREEWKDRAQDQRQSSMD